MEKINQVSLLKKDILEKKTKKYVAKIWACEVVLIKSFQQRAKCAIVKSIGHNQCWLVSRKEDYLLKKQDIFEKVNFLFFWKCAIVKSIGHNQCRLVSQKVDYLLKKEDIFEKLNFLFFWKCASVNFSSQLGAVSAGHKEVFFFNKIFRLHIHNTVGGRVAVGFFGIESVF